MLSLLLSLISLLFCIQAFSQEVAPLTLKERQEISSEIEDGWTPKLILSGHMSLGSSQNVIGQIDGDTKTFGTSLDAGLTFRSGPNQWQNTFSYVGAITTTPAVDDYVKTADELKIGSLYLRSLKAYPRVGPYVRLQLRTSAFAGVDVRAEPQTYVVEENDGSTETISGRSRFTLTDAFSPLTTRESVGAFFTVADRKTLQFLARLGFGAQQVDASGGLAIDDDKSTDEIEVITLTSYDQAGIEGGLSILGELDDVTGYALEFDFLTPLEVDLEEGDDRSNTELTNIELGLKLNSKVYDWMSVAYTFGLIRQPQLLDATQTTHLFTLNFDYTFF